MHTKHVKMNIELPEELEREENISLPNDINIFNTFNIIKNISKITLKLLVISQEENFCIMKS